MARGADIKTPEGIASFTADLFEARERENGGKSYGFAILFPKTTDLAALKQVVVTVCKDEWGEKAVQMLNDGLIKSPFLDGDGKQGISTKTGERHPGYAGKTFIRCTSGDKYRPKVVNRQVLPVTEVADIPSGSRVSAVVNPYTWEHKTNGKGVTFGVSLVQVVKKAEGDEILGGGGGPAPEKYFEAIADEGDAPAETKTGAGAKGFFG